MRCSAETLSTDSQKAVDVIREYTNTSLKDRYYSFRGVSCRLHPELPSGEDKIQGLRQVHVHPRSLISHYTRYISISAAVISREMGTLSTYSRRICCNELQCLTCRSPQYLRDSISRLAGLLIQLNISGFLYSGRQPQTRDPHWYCVRGLRMAVKFDE
jgi:hypothetical protein